MKKPRVVIYYDNRFGRNDGPPFYYFNVLKDQLKLDTSHLLPDGNTTSFGKFDLHFWVDWGEDGLNYPDWKIPDDGGKKIYVVSDAHLGRDYRFRKALSFDYVFFNQKHFLEDFVKVSKHLKHLPKTFYLPHAAEPKAYPKFRIVKKWDFCFIGHIHDYQIGNSINVTRVEALDRLFKEFPNFYFGTRNGLKPGYNIFEDASKKFSQSRVVFNISIGNDVNMRFFEVLSSGSFLLTNWIPELKNIEGLKPGVHYETYKTLDEAVKKTNYYLKHPKEREAIALAGHRVFLEKHTYRKRVEEILSIKGVI